MGSADFVSSTWWSAVLDAASAGDELRDFILPIALDILAPPAAGARQSDSVLVGILIA